MGARRRTVLVSIGGVMAVAMYAALAAVQILVLNPLAAAPGRTLGEIRSDLSGAGESLGAEAAFFVLGIGLVLAVFVAVVAVVSKAPVRLTVMLFLALLMLGAPGYFIASFGAGMGLADTYGIGGADYSPWAKPLFVVSAGAFVALITQAVLTVRSSRPPSSPQAPAPSA